MALLLFSTQACEKGRTQQHRTKGQIFGSGLQLCASGAPAKPESLTPYRDQRHPHTLKCQAQRRARESEPKRGGEDKTHFIMALNLGVACWKGQGATLWHWALPRTFPSGCPEKRRLTMPALFFNPSAMSSFLQHLPASVRKQDFVSKRCTSFWLCS